MAVHKGWILIRYLLLAVLALVSLLGRADDNPDVFSTFGWDTAMTEARKGANDDDLKLFDAMDLATSKLMVRLGRNLPERATIKQIALVRMRKADGYGSMSLLYKTDERAVVITLSVYDGRQGPAESRYNDYYRTVSSKDWDDIFDELRGARQQSPKGMRESGQVIKPGYIGALYTFDGRKSRQILLTGTDAEDIYLPTFLNTLACATPLSGGHCRNYPRIMDGWLTRTLYRAQYLTPAPVHELQASLCNEVSKGNWDKAEALLGQGLVPSKMQAAGQSCLVRPSCPGGCGCCQQTGPTVQQQLDWLSQHGFDIDRPDYLGRTARPRQSPPPS